MAQALRGIQTKAGPGVHWGVEIEDTGAHIQLLYSARYIAICTGIPRSSSPIQHGMTSEGKCSGGAANHRPRSRDQTGDGQRQSSSSRSPFFPNPLLLFNSLAATGLLNNQFNCSSVRLFFCGCSVLTDSRSESLNHMKDPGGLRLVFCLHSPRILSLIGPLLSLSYGQ